MTNITPRHVRPPYEALDQQGRPYTREARTISELEHKDRKEALEAAIPALATAIGTQPNEKLSYAVPVYEAFGMTRKAAIRHEQSDLLLTMACDLSLNYVPKYTNPAN